MTRAQVTVTVNEHGTVCLEIVAARQRARIVVGAGTLLDAIPNRVLRGVVQSALSRMSSIAFEAATDIDEGRTP